MAKVPPGGPRRGTYQSPAVQIGSSLTPLQLVPGAVWGRWRKSPCADRLRAFKEESAVLQECCEHQPLGGAEVDIGVLFADIRGYTTMAEKTPTEDVARMLNRFYRVVGDVLFGHDALVDKLIGDEVMALFIPGLVGKDYVSRMVSAADILLHRIGYGSRDGPWLPIGVGLGDGPAWVGNIGTKDVFDFTALGDVVNTAARLQAEAKPGQIVMSERVYEAVSERYPTAISKQLTLKGKAESVAARVLDMAHAGSAVAAP